MSKKTPTDTPSTSTSGDKTSAAGDPFAPGAPSKKDKGAKPTSKPAATEKKSVASPGVPALTESIKNDTFAEKKTKNNDSAPAFGTAKKKKSKALWLLPILLVLVAAAAYALPFAVKHRIPGAAQLAAALPAPVLSALGVVNNNDSSAASGSIDTVTPQNNRPDETQPKAPAEDNTQALPPLTHESNAVLADTSITIASSTTVRSDTPVQAVAVTDSIAGLRAELNAARATASAEREASQRYIASLEATLRKKEAALYALQSGREEAEILQEGAQLLVKDVAGLYANEALLRRYTTDSLDEATERQLLTRISESFPAIIEKASTTIDDVPVFITLSADVDMLKQRIDSKATAALTWDFLPDKLAKLLARWLSIRKDDPNPAAPVVAALEEGDIHLASLLAQDIPTDIEGAQDIAARLKTYAAVRAAASRALDMTEKKLSGKLSGL